MVDAGKRASGVPAFGVGVSRGLLFYVIVRACARRSLFSQEEGGKSEHRVSRRKTRKKVAGNARRAKLKKGPRGASSDADAERLGFSKRKSRE